ncbi:MAG: ribose 5-phosphate isomerase A [Flavitalea sp.]
MDYKKQAAIEAAKLVQKNQVIGLGAGNTIAFLAEVIATDAALAGTTQFVSSSSETLERLNGLNLTTRDASAFAAIDIYFDGCDQVDQDLNALKSGAGIHSDEKTFASMAKRFVIVGDESKLSETLDTTYPFVLEIHPSAITSLSDELKTTFNIAEITLRKDASGKALKTSRGCLLIDVKLNELPELYLLNEVKLWPGVIDHSLFYDIVTDAILCGPAGIQQLSKTYL